MIIQCDFDGTITTNNISLLLREKFAISNWPKIESDYLCGRLTVEESNKRQYALIKESREKLEALARKNAPARTIINTTRFPIVMGWCSTNTKCLTTSKSPMKRAGANMVTIFRVFKLISSYLK